MNRQRTFLIAIIFLAAACGNPFVPDVTNPLVGIWRSERVSLVDGQPVIQHPNLTFLEDKSYFEGDRRLGTYSYRSGRAFDPHGFPAGSFSLKIYLQDETVEVTVRVTDQGTRLNVGIATDSVPSEHGPIGSYVKVHTGRGLG